MQNNNKKKQMNPLPFKTLPPNESELYYLFLVLYAWGGIARLDTEISPDIEVERAGKCNPGFPG